MQPGARGSRVAAAYVTTWRRVLEVDGCQSSLQGVLVGLAAAVQVLFVGHLVQDAAPELWESRWVQDDAYISFRYARNLVEGNGLVFNVGERVEGYTNFLWTLMSAAPLAAGSDDPLPSMHRAGLVLWFATYGLLLVFGVGLVSRKVYTAPLVAAPLVAHWSFNQWYLSGMETPLVAFLTLLVLVIFAFQEPGRRLAAAAFGTTSVLLVMARPDTAVFVLGLALAMVACHPRWLADRAFWRRWAPAFLLPGAADLCALHHVAPLVLRRPLPQHLLRQGRLQPDVSPGMGVPSDLLRGV